MTITLNETLYNTEQLQFLFEATVAHFNLVNKDYEVEIKYRNPRFNAELRELTPYGFCSQKPSDVAKCNGGAYFIRIFLPRPNPVLNIPLICHVFYHEYIHLYRDVHHDQMDEFENVHAGYKQMFFALKYPLQFSTEDRDDFYPFTQDSNLMLSQAVNRLKKTNIVQYAHRLDLQTIESKLYNQPLYNQYEFLMSKLYITN